MKKNVLIISPSISPTPGGIQSYAHNLSSALMKKGYNIRVISSSDLEEKVLRDYKYINFFSSSQKAFAKDLFIKSYKHIKWADCVIGLTWRVLIPCLPFLKNTRTPYILCTHGTELSRGRTRFLGKIVNKVLSNSSYIIANSTFTSTLTDNYKSKTKIIHPGINLKYNNKMFKSSIRKETSDPILLTVARLVSRKGIDNVIYSVNEAIKKWPNLTYNIIGDGNDRGRLEKIVEDLGLVNNIFFLGRVSDEELEKRYEESDIFILTSRDEDGDIEGFGIVYLEANSHGTPVIGSKTGGVPDAIFHERSGLLVTPDSPSELLKAITQIVNGSMKNNNFPLLWAIEHSWDNISKQWSELLDSLT